MMRLAKGLVLLLVPFFCDCSNKIKSTQRDVPQGPAGQVSITSSDSLLVEIFNWAKSASISHVGSPIDPVGPWYEAALPNREAFCIRDVSHQCIGNEIAGQGKENLNIMENFVSNISDSKDYCSFWEINRYNKPAPVDYTSDEDFWYNLNANFDLIDASYKLYQWTGNKRYINSALFDNFFRLTLNQYIDRWQLQADSIMHRPPFINRTDNTRRFREARGIPSYDESQDNVTVSGDLVAMIANAFSVYSKILTETGRTAEAGAYGRKAEQYRQLIEAQWWDSLSGTYFDFYKTDKKFYHGGIAKAEYLLWYQQINDSMRVARSLQDIRNSQTEVLSYLPMLFYRYGLSEEAYGYLEKIYEDPRRMYPEASSGAIEGVVRGLIGIEPSASENRILTCSRLHREDMWVKVENVPVFKGRISVKHLSSTSTVFVSHSPQRFTWRAAFRGNKKKIIVKGTEYPAAHFTDVLNSQYSYVDIPVRANTEITAEAKN